MLFNFGKGSKAKILKLKSMQKANNIMENISDSTLETIANCLELSRKLRF
jgi:hypothetical protein